MNANIDVWKRLSRSNRVISLVNAKHLLPHEARAMMYVIARMNMIVNKSDRVFITDIDEMEVIDLGTHFYRSLQAVRDIAGKFGCSVHVSDYIVYAGKEDIVIHLAKLDNTNNEKLE